MLNSGNFFVKRALEEGIEVLHDKRHATNIIAKARKRK
jgi:hypothetical protein